MNYHPKYLPNSLFAVCKYLSQSSQIYMGHYLIHNQYFYQVMIHESMGVSIYFLNFYILSTYISKYETRNFLVFAALQLLKFITIAKIDETFCL